VLDSVVPVRGDISGAGASVPLGEVLIPRPLLRTTPSAVASIITHPRARGIINDFERQSGGGLEVF
jgi:hypothetical protein